jgi:hypothetical protein
LFILIGAAVLLLAALTWPTIDFDEGYFFQAGVHATQTGKLGFPWADAYYGSRHVYVPLNSLVSILNWPLAYLPQSWWLFAGRLLSASAICAGVALLYVRQRRSPASLYQTGILLFAATCLPLILYGRTIRPDGLAFFGVCCALFLAFLNSGLTAFGAGLAIAFTALAHAVHGALAGCVVFGLLAFLPVPSGRAVIKRLLAFCIGVATPVVLFYGVYCLVEQPISVWHDVNLLVRLAPRTVSSFAPIENIAAWLMNERGQANMWPLLMFAILAVLVPTDASSQNATTVRFLKVSIIAVLLFWVFLYPKKSYSAAVLLLPMSCFILFSCRVARWPRLLTAALAICIIANSALVGRYHWRLFHQPTGMQQIAPIAGALNRVGVMRPHAAIMGKLWLLFALPRDVTLWDVTVFPRMLGLASGLQGGIAEAIRRSDAVVLEREGNGWADGLQAASAGQMTDAGWRHVTVRTSRYFQPIDIEIFTARAK